MSLFKLLSQRYSDRYLLIHLYPESIYTFLSQALKPRRDLFLSYRIVSLLLLRLREFNGWDISIFVFLSISLILYVQKFSRFNLHLYPNLF